MNNGSKKDDRTEVRITCYTSELVALNKRLELSNLPSMSRYLLECGLNVRGTQDWQERVMLVQLMANLTVLTNHLLGKVGTEIESIPNKEVIGLKNEVEELKQGLARLLYLYQTNLFDKEEAVRVQTKLMKTWNYFTTKNKINN